MDVHLKSLLSRYHEQFGPGPGLGPGSGTCLTKVDGVGPPFIRSLYRAAASLYRTGPWRRLRPGHLLGVRVGKNWDWRGGRQPFPCVQFVGGGGGGLGIHMFRSIEDASKCTGTRETIRVPDVELLRVTYGPYSTTFESNKRMVKSLGLEKSGEEERCPVFDVVHFTSAGGVEFRSPTFEELRFAYAVLRGVALVHPLLEEDIGAAPRYSRSAWFCPLIETVDVEWTAEMAKGNNSLVAVTVFHPPDRGYEETSGSASSTPTKCSEGSSFG